VEREEKKMALGQVPRGLSNWRGGGGGGGGVNSEGSQGKSSARLGEAIRWIRISGVVAKPERKS